MSVDTLDARELSAMKEVVDKRLQAVWAMYQDTTLRAQIDQLAPAERAIIDRVASDFIVTEMTRQRTNQNSLRNDIVLECKPVGGVVRDGDRFRGEGSKFRTVHRDLDPSQLEQFDAAITNHHRNLLDVLGLPDKETSRNDIFVQIIPVGKDNIAIRCITRAAPSNVEHRKSSWRFNMMARTDSLLSKLLKSGLGGKLLPFIARNILTATNPEAAILCDAGVLNGGNMDVVDFSTKTVTSFPASDSLTGGNKGRQEIFADLAAFKGYVKDRKLGRDAQSQFFIANGQFNESKNAIPIFSGGSTKSLPEDFPDLEYSYSEEPALIR